jgi:hypothetical protein
LRFPSQSGDLNEYGEGFAEFLAGFAPTTELPYLAEVARLEWQVHRAHYAADAIAFDAARLAAIAPARQSQLRMRLHPACHIVHSTYPLARLWLIHQPDFVGPVDIDPAHGPTHSLVYRPGFRVKVCALAEAQSGFLEAAYAGANLQDALTAAQTSDPKFDLGGCLIEWVRSSIIVDFWMDKSG